VTMTFGNKCPALQCFHFAYLVAFSMWLQSLGWELFISFIPWCLRSVITKISSLRQQYSIDSLSSMKGIKEVDLCVFLYNFIMGKILSRKSCKKLDQKVRYQSYMMWQHAASSSYEPELSLWCFPNLKYAVIYKQYNIDTVYHNYFCIEVLILNDSTF
jgi:hypothetical protein